MELEGGAITRDEMYLEFLGQMATITENFFPKIKWPQLHRKSTTYVYVLQMPLKDSQMLDTGGSCGSEPNETYVLCNVKQPYFQTGQKGIQNITGNFTSKIYSAFLIIVANC